RRHRRARSAGETLESMPQHSQPLAQRALLFPYSRDLAFRLPVRNLTVHGIDCLARIGHSVAVLAMLTLRMASRWTPTRAAVLASSGTDTAPARDAAAETWLGSLTHVSRGRCGSFPGNDLSGHQSFSDPSATA